MIVMKAARLKSRQMRRRFIFPAPSVYPDISGDIFGLRPVHRIFVSSIDINVWLSRVP